MLEADGIGQVLDIFLHTYRLHRFKTVVWNKGTNIILQWKRTKKKRKKKPSNEGEELLKMGTIMYKVETSVRGCWCMI